MKQRQASSKLHGPICDQNDQEVGRVKQRNKQAYPEVEIDGAFPQWQPLAEKINIRIGRGIPIADILITTHFKPEEQRAMAVEIRRLSDGRLTFYPE